MRPRQQKEGNNKDENRNNEIENRKTDKAEIRARSLQRSIHWQIPSKTDRKKKKRKKQITNTGNEIGPKKTLKTSKDERGTLLSTTQHT